MTARGRVIAPWATARRIDARAGSFEWPGRTRRLYPCATTRRGRLVLVVVIVWLVPMRVMILVRVTSTMRVIAILALVGVVVVIVVDLGDIDPGKTGEKVFAAGNALGAFVAPVFQFQPLLGLQA